MVTDDFYRALEDRFRGSRDVIRARQKVYLPVVEAILKQVPKTLLDVDCGRGEWLELLTEHAVPAIGIEFANDLVSIAQRAGLQVTKGESVRFLSQQQDQCYGMISAFHGIEHLVFQRLLAFFKEAYRVLDNNGAMLLETCNPANFFVGAEEVHADPSRGRPTSPVMLSLAAQFSGFERVIVVSLASEDTAMPSTYTTIAFKSADNTSIPLAQSLVTASEFSISHNDLDDVRTLFALAIAEGPGLKPGRSTLEPGATDLARLKQRALESEASARDSQRSEEDAQRRIKALQSQVDLLQGRLREARVRTTAAEAAVKNLDEYVNAILASTSWKISTPVRVVGLAGRKVGVAPRAANKTLKLGLLHAVAYVRNRPVLRQRVANTLARFPRVRARLVRLVGYRALQSVVSGSPLPAVESVDRLTARGRAIYQDLLRAKNDDTK